MTVSIRPHHLLCMLTFLGKGYTPEFVKNYKDVVRRVNAGEAIRIVTGPDEICQPMLSSEDCHCHNESVTTRDEIACKYVRDVLEIELSSGSIAYLTQAQIERLRAAYLNGVFLPACAGCEWQEMCTEIAGHRFKSCRLSGC